MNKKNMFFQKYQLLQRHNIPCMLGLGASGAVQLAIDKKTEKLVAVKKILRKLAVKQVSIHQSFDHPNIVKLIESFFDHETNSTFIVLEYVPNQNLQVFLRSKAQLKTAEICRLFRGICQGLKAIHTNSFMHRDIKPSNILLGKLGCPKICDFGNATEKSTAELFCGTFQYLAPQLLSQKTYNHKVDVWAMGVMLFQILQKRLPFSQRNKSKLLIQMTKPLTYNNKSTKNFTEIIQKTLRFNPQQRPQIYEIIQILNKIQFSDSFSKTQLNVGPIKSLKELQLSQNSTIDEVDQESSINNWQKMKILAKKRNSQIPKVSLKKYINQNHRISLRVSSDQLNQFNKLSFNREQKLIKKDLYKISLKNIFLSSRK